MTWPYARPKPGRLSVIQNWAYQRENPEIYTIRRHYSEFWHIEKAGGLVVACDTHAEAIEFVSGELARRTTSA